MGGGGEPPFIQSPPEPSSALGVARLRVCALLPVSCDESSQGQGSLSEDVEDDESGREEVILSPAPLVPRLQTVSKPIGLSVAKVGVGLNVRVDAP